MQPDITANKLLPRCSSGGGHSADIESGAGGLAELLCPFGQALRLGRYLVHGARQQRNVALVRPISESRRHLVRGVGQRRPSSTEHVCLDAKDR